LKDETRSSLEKKKNIKRNQKGKAPKGPRREGGCSRKIKKK